MSSLIDSIQDNGDDQTINPTIQFCEICNNMLFPVNEEKKLIYECRKPGCPYRRTSDSRMRSDNLVARREFLKEKNLIISNEFALDPTMPREAVDCPKCGYPEAVFLIGTDLEDTKIELIYICGDMDCGHHWKKHVEE